MYEKDIEINGGSIAEIILPDKAQGAIRELREQARRINPRLSLPRVRKAHITLVQLRKSPVEDIPVLFNVLDRTLIGIEPFSLTVNGLREMHDSRSGELNSLALRVQRSDGLIELQRRLVRSLGPYLRKPGQTFRPHVTIVEVGKFLADQEGVRKNHYPLSMLFGNTHIEFAVRGVSLFGETGMNKSFPFKPS